MFPRDQDKKHPNHDRQDNQDEEYSELTYPVHPDSDNVSSQSSNHTFRDIYFFWYNEEDICPRLNIQSGTEWSRQFRNFLLKRK
jgi:hypothetical protein